MLEVADSKSRVAVVALFLFFAGLLLGAYSSKHPETTNIANVFIAEILRPPEVASSTITRVIKDVWANYVSLIRVREENEALERRVQALEAMNSGLLEQQNENGRLRELLDIAEEHQLKGVAANVIAYSPSNWTRTIDVDRGTTDGVSIGMAVVSGRGVLGQSGAGVVGQIVAVGLQSAKILLVSDHASSVDVVVQSNRVRGIVEGSGEYCKLKYVLNEADLKIGDRLISSGMDGVYPKGLLVGIISNLSKSRENLLQLVEVKPSVDFDRLESVFIVTDKVKKG